LGTEIMPMEGSHNTVDAWLVRDDHKATLMLTNFALPRHAIADEQVSFTLKCTSPLTKASIQRIDLEHANAKRHWEQIGKPDYLSPQMVADMKALSELKEENVTFMDNNGLVNLTTAMPPQSVAAIRFDF
jgi:xylan 1,4-beta-xylosidase